MTTLAKAMAGNEQAMEQVIWGSNGKRKLSDQEFKLACNFRLTTQERLRRLLILREVKSFTKPAPKTRKRIAFASLITESDFALAREMHITLN